MSAVRAVAARPRVGRRAPAAAAPSVPGPPEAPGAVALAVSGGPTPGELAAVLAAIEVLRAVAAAAPPSPPAPERSGWRRAAIEEGLRRPLDSGRTE